MRENKLPYACFAVGKRPGGSSQILIINRDHYDYPCHDVYDAFDDIYHHHGRDDSNEVQDSLKKQMQLIMIC